MLTFMTIKPPYWFSNYFFLLGFSITHLHKMLIWVGMHVKAWTLGKATEATTCFNFNLMVCFKGYFFFF